MTWDLILHILQRSQEICGEGEQVCHYTDKVIPAPTFIKYSLQFYPPAYKYSHQIFMTHPYTKRFTNHQRVSFLAISFMHDTYLQILLA
jgi:hypothetical protein